MLDKYLSFDSEKITKNLIIYFLSVFLINFLFKIYLLDFYSLWYDEIISVQSASLDFGLIKHVSEWDNNPPFYFYCLSVWIKLFNDSEFSIRLLSVFFSSLAAGFVFIIANNFFNKTTAIVSSFLILSSDILFFYSHEARAYSLVVLLSLISTFYFFSLKDKPNYRYALLLGLFNFLLIYTHYISGIVILFQAIITILFFNKELLKYYFFSLLFMILLTFLRFTKKQILLIIDFNSSEKTFWLQKSNFIYLKEVMREFLLHQYLILPFIFLILFSVIFIKFKKNKNVNFQLYYFIFVGFFSIAILYLLGKITPIFLDRYLLFTVPFIFILVGFGLSFIKIKIIPIALSIFIFIYFSSKINYRTPKSMDYKGAVCFVKKIKTKTDLVIVKTKDVKALFCYYYDRNYFAQQKQELLNSQNILFCSKWKDVYFDVTKYNRIIVLDSFQNYNPEEADFVNKLSCLKQQYFVTDFYKGVRITFYQ